MRINLEFQLKKKEFTVDYTRPVISFFKKSLKEYDEEFYQEKFLSGNTPKEYTFSCYFHNAKFGEEFLKTESDTMKILFSCANKLESMLFLNAFINQQNKAFKLPNNNEMTLNRIEILPEARNSRERVLVKFLSPLLVQKHFKESNKSWYYVPEDEDFNQEFNYVVSRQLAHFGVDNDGQELELIPVSPKRVVVTVFGLKVPATVGIFELRGNKKVINYLLDSGVGSKRNAGFGLFNVIG